MPGQRRGGGGEDGGAATSLAAQVKELQRAVLSLQGGGRAAEGGGRGAGNRGGGGGGRRGGEGGFQGAARRGGAGGGTAAASSAAGRPGDWECPGCGFFPCFRRAATCIRCGARKPGGGGGGGGGARALSTTRSPSTYLGPVGAGGSRPLLGRRGQMAAPTTGGGGAAQSARTPGPGTAAGPNMAAREPGNALDGDGFQPVRKGAPASRQTNAMQPSRPPVAARTSWAALSEEEDEAEDDEDDRADDAIDVDDQADHGGGGHDEGDADQHYWGQDVGRDAVGDVDQGDQGGDGDDADGVLDERELRGLWTSHCVAVRKLERDPQTPHALLANARAGRDEAEARWRAAKKPHPLVKRLRWADQDLRDAEAKLQQLRGDLERHREEAARRTRDLEERVAAGTAKVAKKRAAIEALHAEGAQQCPNMSTHQATKVAACGISTDVAPALLAAMERLGAGHGGGDTEGVLQELQLVAVSLNRVQGVLQDAADDAAAAATLGPQCYDISGGGRGGSDDGGTSAHTKTLASPSLPNPRWTRSGPHAPWKKAAGTDPPRHTTTPALPTRLSSSEAAVEQARSLLQARAAGEDDGRPGDTEARTDDRSGDGGARAAGGTSNGEQLPRGAETNDLAEAARREHAVAQRQFAQAQQRQQVQPNDAQMQLEETQRQQRQLQHQEEMQRHQAAFQQAAERRAIEEARQREILIASLSPQELALAAQLQAQQEAVGSLAFGSQGASAAAGLVHQANARKIADEAAAAGVQVDVERLVRMSPEELAEWDIANDVYA